MLYIKVTYLIGLLLENYISGDLRNVTLTILEGEVTYQVEGKNEPLQKLGKGASVEVETEIFHKIQTVSSVPSCFMYTYINSTSEHLKEENRNTVSSIRGMHSPFPLLEDTEHTVKSLSNMFGHIGNSLLTVFYDVPMMRRGRM